MKVETPGAPVKPQERQITSCRARGGQHARPSHKHCKACAKYAHAPPQRASTSLYDFHYELLHVLKLYIICMLLCMYKSTHVYKEKS